MPCLEKIVRPPAYAPPWRFVDAVKSFFTGLLWPVIRCHHSRPGLPINGRQRCLDCGATRSYIHNSDFEHGNAGVRVGAWRKAERLHQNAQRLRKLLINGNGALALAGFNLGLGKPGNRRAKRCNPAPTIRKPAIKPRCEGWQATASAVMPSTSARAISSNEEKRKSRR